MRYTCPSVWPPDCSTPVLSQNRHLHCVLPDGTDCHLSRLQSLAKLLVMPPLRCGSRCPSQSPSPILLLMIILSDSASTGCLHHSCLLFSRPLSPMPFPPRPSVLCSALSESGGKVEQIHASPSESQDEAFYPLTTTWCLPSSLTWQRCCAKFFRPISISNPLFPTLDQDSSVFITLAPQPCPHLVKP